MGTKTWATMLALCAVARGDAVETERDELIARIGRGEAGSVERFARLYREHTQRLAREKTQADDARAADEARRARREAYRGSADSEIADHCGLSVDPQKPVISPTDRRSDWGRVIDKRVVTLRAKNPFAGGADETVTYYTIAGRAQTHLVRGEPRDGSGRGLVADKGDLVLVCWSDPPTSKPPAWETLDDFRAWVQGRIDAARRADRARGIPENIVARERIDGWTMKIAAPPRIAAKARWNPVHIGDWQLYPAITDATWPKLPSPYVLLALEIDSAAAGGRWLVKVEDPFLRDPSHEFLVEVPPGTPRAELLAPEAHVWAILGRPRFDPALRRLVLVAEDIESSYLK